jgi:CDP-diacylglycerol--serine O-phosphatidyltransferase
MVVCSVSRLARFNVTAAALAGAATGKVNYFEGTPITVSVLIAGVLAVAFGTGRTGDALWLGVTSPSPARLHPIALLDALAGCSMISATPRIPKP